MQQNLSEEWWDEIFKDHQESVDRFFQWVEDYKRMNAFESLFNAGLQPCIRALDGNGYDPIGSITQAPKFHDLPLAMQVGILIEYFGWNIRNNQMVIPDTKFNTVLDGYIWSFKWHFEHNTIPQRELVPCQPEDK